jgi:CHAD domain-containing protein
MAETSLTLLEQALDKRWQVYAAQLETCRLQASKEAVHDLRVAMRRLLAVIDLFRALQPGPTLQKIRKRIKEQLDHLDELRDTQVILADLINQQEQLPESRSFISHLQKRERDLLRAGGKYVHSIRVGGLNRQIHSVMGALEKYAETTDLDALIPTVMDDYYARVLHQVSLLDPERAATIHQVRIAFRKFRYMMEIIFPLLPAFPQEMLKQLHDYQDRMGHVQDIEILLEYLNEYVDKKHSFDPTPLSQFFYSQHQAAIDAFFASQGQVHDFWRPSAGAKYPWVSSTRRKRTAPALQATKNSATDTSSLQEATE